MRMGPPPTAFGRPLAGGKPGSPAKPDLRASLDQDGVLLGEAEHWSCK